MPSYEIVRTKDGSDTVRLIEGDVTFHSLHGAIQESRHVFIEHGLKALTLKDDLSVFEMGFGTGLNALLTLQFAQTNQRNIHYHSIESQPLSQAITSKLNYSEQLDLSPEIIHAFHAAENFERRFLEYFTLNRQLANLESFQHKQSYHIIFFDAFGPGHSPELWGADILSSLFHQLEKDGCLVTFCAQGAFKRCLRTVGFEVEALPGPPGKREMTRAWRR